LRSADLVGAVPVETPANRVVVWIAASLGIAAIGGIAFFSGTELRVFPLYYAPISLVAWRIGRSSALLATCLSTAAWLGSNLLAGLQYSHPVVWVVNTLVQATSFAIVGFLIATLKTALIRERRLSRTDPLTSLLNTRAFYEEAPRLLALCRRNERPVTLAYIDLDNFKAVNDVLGHQAGDDLLQSMAALLRGSTRPSDLCARLGGDEFAVLLPEAGQADAALALERLRVRVSEAMASEACTVTCSIGAVTFLTIPEDLEAMVRAVDAGMYVAKANGKNRLHLETVRGTAAPAQHPHASRKSDAQA
jgi:diguanylate cyclase (GGDEF)-like protein